MSPVVLNGIAIVVTIVWALTVLADVVVDGYSPPPGVHIAFSTVLGGLFGVQIVRKR